MDTTGRVSSAGEASEVAKHLQYAGQSSATKNYLTPKTKMLRNPVVDYPTPDFLVSPPDTCLLSWRVEQELIMEKQYFSAFFFFLPPTPQELFLDIYSQLPLLHHEIFMS